MEIELNKSEDNITLLITLAKEYGEALEQEINGISEPDYIADTEHNCFSCNNDDFINKFIPLTNALIMADQTKRCDIDSFLLTAIDNIMSTAFPASVYCLDARNDSIFEFNNIYLTLRINDIEDGFTFLETIDKEYENDLETDRFIIINQYNDWFFEDNERFCKVIQELLKNPKNHVICVSTETTLLTEDVLGLFVNRIGFWIGSTRCSKMLFGRNIACTPLSENSVIFSNDYGQSFTIEHFSPETNDPLLDI